METTKLNLDGNYQTQNLNKLDEFMDRYEKKDTLYIEDFKILITEVDRLKNVINTLHNENNESKNELNKYKIEYQKLYKFHQKYKKELEQIKTKAFIPKKKIQQITDQQIQEIKTLRNQGLSYSEIERITKWSKYTISRVLNGHYDAK